MAVHKAQRIHGSIIVVTPSGGRQIILRALTKAEDTFDSMLMSNVENKLMCFHTFLAKSHWTKMLEPRGIAFWIVDHTNVLIFGYQTKRSTTSVWLGGGKG